MSMTEFHRRVLEKVALDFLNDLDCEDIVPHLVADEAITRHDREKINAKATRKERVAGLLEILPMKGDGAYISLQSSLTKTDGSMHLYETMKKHEEGLSCQPQQELQEEKLPRRAIEGIDLPVNKTPKPQNPDKVLKDPDLLDLAQELGEHWEVLALKLGMSKAVIYQCKENNRYNTQSQICDMLYKWKCSQGKKATVSAMLEACKQIKLLSEDAYEFLYKL